MSKHILHAHDFSVAFCLIFNHFFSRSIVNVLHIAKTSIYDSAADVVAALDIMKDTYSGDSWHYADPTTGENPGKI